MKHPRPTPSPIVWELYECDKGQRWSAVKGGPYEHAEGEECGCSGCDPGHTVHKWDETADLHTAHVWFHRVQP